MKCKKCFYKFRIWWNKMSYCLLFLYLTDNGNFTDVDTFTAPDTLED